jgi:hypothetical protein
MTSTAEANRGRQPADATSNDNHFHGPYQMRDRIETDKRESDNLGSSHKCFLVLALDLRRRSNNLRIAVLCPSSSAGSRVLAHVCLKSRRLDSLIFGANNDLAAVGANPLGELDGFCGFV